MPIQSAAALHGRCSARDESSRMKERRTRRRRRRSDLHDPVSCTSLAFLSPITILPVKSIFPRFNPRTYDPSSSSSIPQPPSTPAAAFIHCVYRCIYRCIYQGARSRWEIRMGRVFLLLYVGMVKSWKLFTVETCNLRGR